MLGVVWMMIFGHENKKALGRRKIFISAIIHQAYKSLFDIIFDYWLAKNRWMRIVGLVGLRKWLVGFMNGVE